ncbi:hypothetical protein D516_1092 [Rhodobacter sp. AKP1]|nr:hypothetical protein D516_1092 [Rhodobacter sp. AKP1]
MCCHSASVSQSHHGKSLPNTCCPPMFLPAPPSASSHRADGHSACTCPLRRYCYAPTRSVAGRARAARPQIPPASPPVAEPATAASGGPRARLSPASREVTGSRTD